MAKWRNYEWVADGVVALSIRVDKCSGCQKPFAPGDPIHGYGLKPIRSSVSYCTPCFLAGKAEIADREAFAYVLERA